MTETVDPSILTPIPWKVFKPDRPDVRLVGQCGEQLAHVLLPRSGVRDVYASDWNVGHYLGKHLLEFDMALAEGLLPEILLDPVMLCEGEKAELLFLGEYSREHYLVVPVKPMPGELWLKTLFMTNVKRAEKKIRKGQWKILHKRAR